jgi:nucleotide-binding universal stress UspA family protein
VEIYDPKAILLPVDFSVMNKTVLRAGLELGRRREAEVCVLHVVRGTDYMAYYSGEFSGGLSLERVDEDSKMEAKSQLEKMLREVAAGPNVRQIVATGDPVNEIVRHAEFENIDLIVMATQGRRGVSRLLFGSVTEQVIRCAPCPVLAIRHQGHDPVSIRVEQRQESAVLN